MIITVWTPEKIGRLTKLWNLGWTAGEISRDLLMTRNAVIGKAHRLGLKPRLSPIKRAPWAT